MDTIHTLTIAKQNIKLTHKHKQHNALQIVYVAFVSGAARMVEIISDIKPEVIVFEEAAEVLESHILACLNQFLFFFFFLDTCVYLR